MTISDTAQRHEASVLWTLEEIGRLVSESGDPAETLSNIVHLIRERFSTDVCSVYLLEPDRANLVLAATVGLRPESVGRVRMRLSEGLAGLVAEQLRPEFVAEATSHPRFKYFPDAGEDPYRSFLGVPLIDRGILQGVLVVQTVDARTFDAEDMRLLMMAGSQLAPMVTEARSLGQLVAPAHQKLSALAQNLWWSWDPDTTSLFREIDPVLWRALDNNPVALLQQIPIDTLEERASQLALHSRINYAYRRLQEYLHSTSTWGARHAGVLWARPVAYFSAEFGIHESLPIYSGGLGILAGDHIKSASDLGVPLVGVGLYYDQGYFRQRLDREGWQHEDYIDLDHRTLPIRPAAGRRRARSPFRSRPGPGRCTPASGNAPSAATRCCSSIRTSTATSRRIASSPPGSTAATSGFASARNCCSASAACGRWPRSASRPACSISTKATARSPRSKSCASAWRRKASTP